jgi:hypothetical protein
MTIENTTPRWRYWLRPALLAAAVLAGGTATAGAQQARAVGDPNDPRIGLRGGYHDAATAARSMELLRNTPRPAEFTNPASPGDMMFANTDMAFRGDLLFLGNFHGFMIYDISNPAAPRLRTSVICPGGQADVSVFGDLLFMSVEMPNGRVDCGVNPPMQQSSPARFRGVRVFDISNLDRPRQVAAVQTCRGSHTHTVVTRPGDTENVYVYNSGASYVRPAAEMPGCVGPALDPATALFRIEVIQVPLAAPQDAHIVNAPRIFADRETGTIAGLWPGGRHGEGTQWTSRTDQCHDITAYPAIGMAAGACAGNGILLDIRDPANPVRIAEVADPNFAYWHSAAFNNAGTKVIFTDEWGGGGEARCRATDLPEWGANAIFDIVDGRLQLASYYKLPAPQSAQENCVAHNGSLVPVPGRDIKVQSWYQGGISVFDFTDSANPVEIAFFDRGPLSETVLVMAGHWSAYWYNGHIYGSEIARGLDVLRLTPGEHLTRNEIDAANLVRYEEFNPQLQPRVTWPAHPTVARAYIDQLRRGNAMTVERAAAITGALDQLGGARRSAALAQLGTLAAQLEQDAGAASVRSQDAARMRALAETLRGLGSATP